MGDIERSARSEDGKNVTKVCSVCRTVPDLTTGMGGMSTHVCLAVRLVIPLNKGREPVITVVLKTCSGKSPRFHGDRWGV
jgi:hypothetical protein